VGRHCFHSSRLLSGRNSTRFRQGVKCFAGARGLTGRLAS
jgi:hypothetical protein